MEESKQPKDIIFVMDIGTRSVIGVVGKKKDDLFEVLEVEYLEHQTRAMKDGQIEDIGQVALVADRVKQSLEKKSGLSLDRVHVAAAGRSLKTCIVSVTQEISKEFPITPEQVNQLQMQSIDKGYEIIYDQMEELHVELSCVGYSIRQCFLDGYPIANLVGHKGSAIQLEAIVTFLPVQVVHGLYSAMEQIGVQVHSLTLEPIAAMNAVVPDELKMLNIALIDIGAGTADIAIAKDSMVVGYNMATVAGDEVTEHIVKTYLVDFLVAEKMKRQLSFPEETEITYTNILGFSQTITKETLQKELSVVTNHLAKTIAQKILEMNETPPAATFLVGGGSKLEGLCQLLAEQLDVPSDKVVIGGNNFIKQRIIAPDSYNSPEFVTPMGIGITGLNQDTEMGYFIFVNGQKVSMLKQNNTVLDVILLSGYKNTEILGKTGSSLGYVFNGEKKLLRGGRPQVGEITVNGEGAGLSTLVHRGDQVVFLSAVHGEDARITLGDFMEEYTFSQLYVEDALVKIIPVVKRNELSGDPTLLIEEGDRILVKYPKTAEEVLAYLGHDPADYAVFVKETEISLAELLQPKEEIKIYQKARVTTPEPSPFSQMEEQPRPEDIPKVQESTKALPKQETPILEKEMPPLDIILNRERLSLPPKADKTPYLFVDMLNYVTMDPKDATGDIVLNVNGIPASYTQEVKAGDEIEIGWSTQEKREETKK